MAEQQTHERLIPEVNRKPFLGMKITRHDPRNPGNRTLSYRWHAMEFGRREIAETYGNPHLPGVRVVDLFVTPYMTDDLEAAKSHCPTPTRFLLSRTVKGIFVVSSRMGYDSDGKVDVMPANGRSHPEYVDAEFDFHDYSYQESGYPGALIERHQERISALGSDIVEPFEQDEADFAFRAMIAGCKELR